ncbi:hypothetical protein KAV67_04610 [Candidatus Bipolaricaulota bacterium]|nr:hypothetical protein [Candidatus Bipolaricaulota bacterium]
MNRIKLEERVFELVGYMVTSGRNLLNETPLYGPFRLVDAASRLISILEEEGVGSDRLQAMRTEIDAGKYSVMSDVEEFESFLDSLVDTLVDHADFEERR